MYRISYEMYMRVFCFSERETDKSDEMYMRVLCVFREMNKSYKMYMMMFYVLTQRERQVIQSVLEGVLFFERERERERRTVHI